MSEEISRSMYYRICGLFDSWSERSRKSLNHPLDEFDIDITTNYCPRTINEDGTQTSYRAKINLYNSKEDKHTTLKEIGGCDKECWFNRLQKFLEDEWINGLVATPK